jgi:hypothetical protein
VGQTERFAVSPEGVVRKTTSNVEIENTITAKSATQSKFQQMPALTLAGLILSALPLLAFLPRVTVSAPTMPFDSRSVQSVSFDITSAGMTTLNDVDVLFDVGHSEPI